MIPSAAVRRVYLCYIRSFVIKDYSLYIGSLFSHPNETPTMFTKTSDREERSKKKRVKDQYFVRTFNEGIGVLVLLRLYLPDQGLYMSITAVNWPKENNGY